MFRTSDELFNAMEAIVRAPGYPFLQAYQDDFYKLDRDYLDQFYTVGSSFIWIVRENGTHLHPVGVDEKFNECLEAVFSSYNETSLDIFSIHRGELKRITMKKARDVMSHPHYETVRGVVSRLKVPIAAINVLVDYRDQTRYTSAVITSFRENERRSLDELIALQVIAECECVRVTQSLFTQVGLITLDGVDIDETIRLAKAQATPMLRLAA